MHQLLAEQPKSFLPRSLVERPDAQQAQEIEARLIQPFGPQRKQSPPGRREQIRESAPIEGGAADPASARRSAPPAIS